MEPNESTPNAQKIEAVRTIHAEFERILESEKCRSCACFYGDVLNRALEKIRKVRQAVSDSRLEEIEADFERWIEAAEAVDMHG